jgi:hypothetical protein
MTFFYDTHYWAQYGNCLMSASNAQMHSCAHLYWSNVRSSVNNIMLEYKCHSRIATQYMNKVLCYNISSLHVLEYLWIYKC